MAEKKPNIRFKGFEEEWKDKTLGSMGETTSGVGFPIQEQGGKSGIPFFKVSDMNTIGNEREMTASNNYVSSVQIEKNNWKPIQELPAIFFAKIGAALLHNRKRLIKKPFLLDNNTMAYSMNNKEGDFFLSLFETINLPKYAQTGALPSYGETDIKAIEVKVPTICEQQKIGEFFKQLDELIGAKEQELEKLRQIKLALLDKMFPCDNQENINRGGYNSLIKNILYINSQLMVTSPAPNTPTIRFRGFTEPWEKYPISRRVTYGKGRGYSKANLQQSGTPILLYGTLYTDYNTNITEVNRYSTKKDWAIMSKGTEVVVPASGETAEDIARASAILKAGIILGGDLNIIYPNDKLDASFLALELTYGNSHRKLVKKAQGISVVHIHNTDISELEINVPSYDEQRKIGDFFRSQDEVIANSQRQINKLKTIKQACLSQMFA